MSMGEHTPTSWLLLVTQANLKQHLDEDKLLQCTAIQGGGAWNQELFKGHALKQTPRGKRSRTLLFNTESIYICFTK